MRTMRVAIMILAGSCGAAPALMGVVEASEWPMFGRDLAHNAKTPDVGPDSASILWSYSLRPSTWGAAPVIRSSPVVGDGAVFVAALSGSLWCFEADQGGVRWMVDVGTPLSSTPAVSDEKVYVLGGADDRCLHAYCAKTGNGAWTSAPLGAAESWVEIGYGERAYWMESSPAVVGDSVLFVGAPNGYLYCIRISGTGNILGTIKWSACLGA
jgi:outer membrane protein assembly factor BamB